MISKIKNISKLITWSPDKNSVDIKNNQEILIEDN